MRIDAVLKAMEKAGIKPAVLGEKEGLSLLNGTYAITALAAFNAYYAERLFRNAEIASASTLEALKGNLESFDPKIHALKNHSGQIQVAAHVRMITSGTKLMNYKNKDRVQDAYSLRCIPQILGPVQEGMEGIIKKVEDEMNSVSDNPLVIDDKIISGGNFHGQYIAASMDYLAILVNTMAELSERHKERLLNSSMSNLPAFLAKNPGLNSGLMIAQYASAALALENKGLLYPASALSASVSAGQEDIVSNGMNAAKKARDIIRNTEHIVGIELMCAMQALDFYKPEDAGIGTYAAYKKFRKKIKPLEEDRALSEDIEKAYKLVHSGKITGAVEKKAGWLAWAIYLGRI